MLVDDEGLHRPAEPARGVGERRLAQGAAARADVDGGGHAQPFADRVAVLRDGEIVRIGRPSELTARTRAQIRYVKDGAEVVLDTDEPTRTLHELTAAAVAQGVELEGLEVRRATLEDVYLELVAEDRERT